MIFSFNIYFAHIIREKDIHIDSKASMRYVHTYEYNTYLGR